MSDLRLFSPNLDDQSDATWSGLGCPVWMSGPCGCLRPGWHPVGTSGLRLPGLRLSGLRLSGLSLKILNLDIRSELGCLVSGWFGAVNMVVLAAMDCLSGGL